MLGITIKIKHVIYNSGSESWLIDMGWGKGWEGGGYAYIFNNKPLLEQIVKDTIGEIVESPRYITEVWTIQR